MKRFLTLGAMLLGITSVSMAEDRFYLGISFGYHFCPEEKVVYVDRGPDVIIIRPYPVYYYHPYGRVVIVEKKKHKHWRKYAHWDDD